MLAVSNLSYADAQGTWSHIIVQLRCSVAAMENLLWSADEVYHAAISAAGQVFHCQAAENQALVSNYRM